MNGQSSAFLRGEAPPCIVCGLDLEAQLVTIDENLIRHELTMAERAQQTARRKEIYEALHPEAAYESRPGRAGKCRPDGDNSEPAPRFSQATAAATGQSERTVQRDTHRGEKLAEVLTGARS